MAGPPRSFGRDRGLQSRMLLTMFLLGLVYAVLIGALVAAGAAAITIAVVAAGLFLIQLFTSDKIALFSMGARPVSPEQAPELHAIIERLCVAANLPKPKVAIAQTAMPNAFAVGRSPKNATVCVTTGLLQLLEPAELEAVLGHELTHVLNRDVMVMTIASFFASIAAFITQIGFWFGGAFDDNNNGGAIALIAVIAISAAVYIVSFVLLQALSRYREFAADRGSAIITGRPKRSHFRADEDFRHDGADPTARPPRRQRASSPPSTSSPEDQADHRHAVLDPSAAGAADRGARAARVPAPGHRGVEAKWAGVRAPSGAPTSIVASSRSGFTARPHR